ncbi:carboxypeptidase regulatory-like domain-containing protein [Atlantibacter subterranea]|uniref:carboxypeptidase-like regulatory domain-containing protein n=1 Tax=Atlantibacter subterraneus TaxID=255519 RepID=UPI0020C1C025|nr:carboxypeptidase-like regulatory domain-containing protein [Atlantibacter subterranea]UTJ46808.1 carboxypeptidase regulatory-like domain-containing protein [Atlantibacter subterranea]
MFRRFIPMMIVGAFLQSGCVAHTQSQPMVEGRLFDNQGHAVPDANIILQSNGPAVSTVSDQDGFFSFPADYEWSFFLPIGPIDKMNRTELLIQVLGQQYAILLASVMSGPFGSGPAEIGVVCTLPATLPTPKPANDESDICQQMSLNAVKTFRPFP